MCLVNVLVVNKEKEMVVTLVVSAVGVVLLVMVAVPATETVNVRGKRKPLPVKILTLQLHTILLRVTQFVRKRKQSRTLSTLALICLELPWSVPLVLRARKEPCEVRMVM